MVTARADTGRSPISRHRLSRREPVRRKIRLLTAHPSSPGRESRSATLPAAPDTAKNAVSFRIPPSQSLMKSRPFPDRRKREQAPPGQASGGGWPGPLRARAAGEHPERRRGNRRGKARRQENFTAQPPRNCGYFGGGRKNGNESHGFCGGPVRPGWKQGENRELVSIL